MRKHFLLFFIAITGILAGCNKNDPETLAPKDYFTLWNDCEALTALQEYVQDVTNPKSTNYIKEEDRIATFDMDGTFVGELYPSYFEYNLLEYRALDPPIKTRPLRMSRRRHRPSVTLSVMEKHSRAAST